jgi:hypothetical protein
VGVMQQSEAISTSAWAQRSTAVVALSVSLLAAVGAASGLVWLLQDHPDLLWIGLAIAVFAFVVTHAVVTTTSRRRRRDRWDAERAGFSRGTQLTLAEHALLHPASGPDLSHHSDLMADLLAELELVQDQLTELVSQAGTERRASSGGRHARPVLVDVRTGAEGGPGGTDADDDVRSDRDGLHDGGDPDGLVLLGIGAGAAGEDVDDAAEIYHRDDRDDLDDEDDVDDLPYGVGNVLRISDRIDLDAAARGRRVLAARDDEDDLSLHTVVDLSGHGTEDRPATDEDDDPSDDEGPDRR